MSTLKIIALAIIFALTGVAQSQEMPVSVPAPERVKGDFWRIESRMFGERGSATNRLGNSRYEIVYTGGSGSGFQFFELVDGNKTPLGLNHTLWRLVGGPAHSKEICKLEPDKIAPGLKGCEDLVFSLKKGIISSYPYSNKQTQSEGGKTIIRNVVVEVLGIVQKETKYPDAFGGPTFEAVEMGKKDSGTNKVVWTTDELYSPLAKIVAYSFYSSGAGMKREMVVYEFGNYSTGPVTKPR